MSASPSAGGQAPTPRDNVHIPRRSRLHVIAAIAVATSIIALVAFSARSSLVPATAVHVQPVVFEAASGGQTESSPSRPGVVVQGPGWVEPEPYAVACSALADGVVAEILVLEGDRVEAGEVIARLIDDDARLALAAAEADAQAAASDLEQARAALRSAHADWDNPIERTRAVAMATALLEEIVAERARLPHLIAAEQAALDRLVEEQRRTVDARRTNAVTEFEIVIVEQRVKEQAAAVQAVRSQGDVLAAKEAQARADLTAAIESARLRIPERLALDSAEARVRQAEAALAQATARRDEAKLRLSRMTIAAPVTGHVMRRLKAPGDKVMLGGDDPRSAQVAILYDASRIQVRTDVPLADASHLYVGQHCEVVVEILPDRVFTGEVIRILHEADVQKNTLQAKVRIIDPSPLLRPEMLARVKFLPSGRNGVSGDEHASPRALVPSNVIDQREGAAARVWAVRDRQGSRGSLHGVPVRVVEDGTEYAKVEGDIRPTDLLAVPSRDFRHGDRVRIVSTAAHEPETRRPPAASRHTGPRP